MYEQGSRINCSIWMLPREVEMVSDKTGVKRFEQSRGLDTALYRTYLFYFLLLIIIIIMFLNRTL